MAIASAVFPVAHVAPIGLKFPWTKGLNAQVRFYSDTAGEVAIAKGTGARDIEVSTQGDVVSVDGTYTEAGIDSDFTSASQNLVGGQWGEFLFGDGAGVALFTLTGGSNPGGALSYRVWLTVSKAEAL